MVERASEESEPDDVFGGEALCPPERFGIVEPGVCRSNVPLAENFTFVRMLQLKSVLLLSPEIPTRVVSTFFEENKVMVRHLGLKSWRADVSWKPMSEEMVKEGLEFVLDVRNHPLMICDTTGIHLVGTLIGCLRRLQDWNLNSIVNEYRSFAWSKTRYSNEQFFELFDIDLIKFPENMPSWFVEERKINAEEQEEFELLRSQKALGHDGERLGGVDMPDYIRYYYSRGVLLNTTVHKRRERAKGLPPAGPS
uniref:Tyrosine-protein phosphatase domain-containing protein n=1 Tax=Rhodosorus marinus TaxID=101924 RepID=A0A7S3EJ11_9RHOD|mmetsp:Transcript_40303/g.160107  ORF Transcript_40303/g.160107 Transcript_40303/m.160107 type:complete len:252 (+) Transcript_40303:50-805(+)